MKRNILIGAAIIILAVVLSGSYKKLGSLEGIFSKNNEVGVEAAKAKATDFVKNNLVQPGTEISVKEIVKENGLYKIVFTIGKQEVVTYMTTDGAKFFPQVMDIAETQKQAEVQKEKDNAALKDVPKTDKPVVDLYVMSFCPYGNKAEDTMAPVYNLLKNKVDFNFRYIVNSEGGATQSLHGQKEVDQDEREACVLKNYGKDAWMNFVTYVNKNCGSDGACWEAGAKAGNIDTAKVNSCVASEGLALMQADEKLSTEADATGSPTMIINGATTNAVYKYGDSEGYKQAICNAFNESPAECAQELGSATSTAEGGSCN